MNAPELAAGRIIHHDNVTLFVEEETEDGTVLSELPLTNDVGVFLIANNSYDEEPILTTIPAWVKNFSYMSSAASQVTETRLFPQQFL